MKPLPFLAGAGLLLLSSAAPARAAADLSGASIDAATLEEFQGRIAEARRKEAEAAATASADEPPRPDGTQATSEASPEVSEPDASTDLAASGQAASGQPAGEGGEGGEAAAPGDMPKLDGADPFLIRLQVLLDRAHASPGVIDGFYGDNTVKAIRAYEEMRELPVDGLPDDDMWTVLAVDGGAAMKTYEITEEDLDGRYVKEIPQDYADMAKLKWLGFRGPREMLAERFHMDEDLLKTLNPKADFTKAGTKLLVADTGADPETKVTRIVVDKSRGELLAYDGAGAVVLVVPASIGSEDTPSPSGDVVVEAVAPRPNYTYDPSKNFKQGENKDVLTIPPGPNGPVGATWIDLSKPTYGIHGTADPSHIGKTESHGCVRLTNWDVETLSKLVEPKITQVSFQD